MTTEANFREQRLFLTRRDGLLERYPMQGTAAEAAAMSLLLLMAGLSEQYWQASWLNNLEYALWEVRETGPSEYFPATERQAALLHALSEECDGWWMLPDADGSGGPVEFVPLAVWKDRIAQVRVHAGGFVTRT